MRERKKERRRANEREIERENEREGEREREYDIQSNLTCLPKAGMLSEIAERWLKNSDLRFFSLYAFRINETR